MLAQETQLYIADATEASPFGSLFQSRESALLQNNCATHAWHYEILQLLIQVILMPGVH